MGFDAHNLRGPWDLAVSLHRPHEFAHLDPNGEVTRVSHDPPGGGVTADGFERDGFRGNITPSHIKITNGVYTWLCDRDKTAGQQLLSAGDPPSLICFGKQLVVYTRAPLVEAESERRPPLSSSNEQERLTITSHSGIWLISGAKVRVAGDEDDLLVQTPTRLMLWSMSKEKFIWTKDQKAKYVGTICLTEQFALVRSEGISGTFYLHTRKDGKSYASFTLPLYDGFYCCDSGLLFGPVASRSSLVLCKPAKRGICVFRVGKKSLDITFWESDVDLEGLLLLRGDIDNLELRHGSGQALRYRGRKESWRIDRYDFVKRNFIM